jgi:DisA bacterial checkpoint controller nucleotide-binding
LGILAAVAETTPKSSVGWVDFASNESAHFAALEQDVFELSRVLANLTAIDGALVLDKRFGMLGFGAEVSAELPTPERVYRALDAEGNERQPEAVENVGTRHRAAYRFVNDHPDGLAVVISQDGGVTFVAKRGEQVVFWEQSVSP